MITNENLIYYCNHFYGYGSWGNNYWVLGLEERVGNDSLNQIVDVKINRFWDNQYNRNNCGNCRAKIENRVYDFKEGSFFERFMKNFIMEADREFSINDINHPPTLILKNKKFL
jgi:hypothetical protein